MALIRRSRRCVLRCSLQQVWQPHGIGARVRAPRQVRLRHPLQQDHGGVCQRSTDNRTRVYGAMGAGSSKNYCFTDRANGYAYKFTGRPDSVYFWAKFKMQGDVYATAKAHLHTDCDFKDFVDIGQPSDIASAILFFKTKAKADGTSTNRRLRHTPLRKRQQLIRFPSRLSPTGRAGRATCSSVSPPTAT